MTNNWALMGPWVHFNQAPGCTEYESQSRLGREGLIDLQSPRATTGESFRPFGPEVSQAVSDEVSPNNGGCLRGVSGAPRVLSKGSKRYRTFPGTLPKRL